MQDALVGFTFDAKLTWGAMIGALAKKARTRVDAIRRRAPSLDSKNMLTMCSAFVRPILESGSTLFMGVTPTHLTKLGRVQATMERIGGFKAELLAARREAALIALTLKQLDGDCRELLREYAPVLVIVKVPEVKVARNRRPGLLRPDYSEKNQSRRTSTSSVGVKVDVTLASGLQAKDPSKRPKSATSLDVFRDSAAGDLPAIRAKLPRPLVLRGEDKGWRKITKRFQILASFFLSFPFLFLSVPHLSFPPRDFCSEYVFSTQRLAANNYQSFVQPPAARSPPQCHSPLLWCCPAKLVCICAAASLKLQELYVLQVIVRNVDCADLERKRDNRSEGERENNRNWLLPNDRHLRITKVTAEERRASTIRAQELKIIRAHEL